MPKIYNRAPISCIAVGRFLWKPKISDEKLFHFIGRTTEYYRPSERGGLTDGT
jgi:hypothetical protein